MELLSVELLASALSAGFLSFLSPCILPLLPVYVGLLATEDGQTPLALRRRAFNTVAFVAGISVTFFVLGFGAGALGAALDSVYLSVACGIVVFVFGLHFSGVATIPLLERERRADMSKIDAKRVGGAFLLGLAFSFGWTPCIGPVLGSILALAAQQGGALAGGSLLLVYSIGLGIPFLIVTLASSLLLSKIRKLGKCMPAIRAVGGVLIAAMGLWMVFSQVHDMQTALQASPAPASAAQSATGQEDAARSAEAAPSEDAQGWTDVPLAAFDGTTTTLRELQGSPVYLKVWATWCPTCLAGIEDFERLYADHAERGDVQVVSVMMPGVQGEMSSDELAEWAAGQELEFPILLDTSTQFARQVGVRGTPTSLFIDSSGNLVEMRTGDMGRDELEEKLAALS